MKKEKEVALTCQYLASKNSNTSDTFLLLIIIFFYNLIGCVVFITQKIRSKEMPCIVRLRERSASVRFPVGASLRSN